MSRTVVCGVGVGRFLKQELFFSCICQVPHKQKSKSTFCPSVSWGVENAPLPGSSDL